MRGINKMQGESFPVLFLLVFSFFLILIFGCSTTKSVVQKIKPNKDGLRKRVMVLPLIDLAKVGPGESAQINTIFINLLTKSPHFTLHKAPQDMPLPERAQSPETCIATYPEVLQKAEDLGMNALISGVINPIETTTKKTGIWPFRSSSKIYEISLVMNIVDVTTRTLLLTQLESEKTALRSDEVQGQDEKKIIDQVLEKKVPRILKRQASAVNRVMVDEPWSGKILSIENNSILFNAGNDVGIRPGQVFTVFAQGESISCKSGRSVDLLGKKIGEIKATSVMEKHSIAVPMVEAAFLPGQIIRFRP